MRPNIPLLTYRMYIRKVKFPYPDDLMNHPGLPVPGPQEMREGPQYDTRQRKRPWGGALTPAADRSRARRISPT